MLTAAKKNDTRFGKRARAEETASRFVPYTHHVDDTTIHTKEGHLLKVIKLEGMAFETADTLDLNQRKDIRATMLRGLSNSRFALYHHIIRRKTNEALDSEFDNPWCQALDTAYQERLSQKNMFVNEQYITLIRRPAQGRFGFMEEMSHTLFGKLDKEAHAARTAEDMKALNEAAHNLLSTLAPYRPKLLGLKRTGRGVFSESLAFFSLLLNGDAQDIRLPHMGLADYLPRKRLSFGLESFERRGSAPDDVRYGAVLSIKEYAPATGPGMLDTLLRLPHEFVLTQSFGFVNRQTALGAMRDTKRKLMAGEEGADSLEAALDEAIDDLTSGHASFGEHHLTLTVTGESKAALERALSAANSAFTNLGIITAREDINLEAAFWAGLPGNFSFIARRALISNKNFAALASLHNFPAGHKDNNHWGPAITRLETTSGTPYWFNFHERDVGNFTVIGPTGTGKTVLLTFLNAQAQRLKPRTVYFDKDRGAEIYIRAIGGHYTTVTPGKPTGLNPLQLPDTQQNRAFIREWIALLLTCEGGAPLSPQDKEIIADAVIANYEEPIAHRRLSCFAELLAGHTAQDEQSLAARLAMWHSGGARAWLFDNETDSLSLDNKNCGFDLTSILDDRISRTPWLLYIFHRINERLNGERTIIMCDEGWKLLDDPAFSSRIKDWMKTIRKQNGLLGFATQSAKDAINSAAGDTIIEQSATQIFLPNARACESDYCEGFGLSRHEWAIIRKLSPDSRCFLIRHGIESVIARLDLTGLDAFLPVLSGRTGSVNLMDKLIKEHGENPELWLPHLIKGHKKQ